MVAADAGSAKLAGPGPETRLHEEPSVPPTGLPSSLTEPASVATSEKTRRSGPALTTGAWFSVSSVTVTSSLA